MTDVPHDVWPGGLPAVGQVAERSRKVHSSDIERFTDISGDRNPLHYNEALVHKYCSSVRRCRDSWPL